MLRILIVLFGLFLVAALPGGAKAMETVSMDASVDCHGLTMRQDATSLAERHAGHPAPIGKSGLDCCLGTSLCRLACTAIEPMAFEPALTVTPEPEPGRVADAMPLKGHAVPPLLGPPRPILI